MEVTHWQEAARERLLCSSLTSALSPATGIPAIGRPPSGILHRSQRGSPPGIPQSFLEERLPIYKLSAADLGLRAAVYD